MKSYRTAQVAAAIGIHPNTVRLYEELGFIPKAERKANGYRMFTDFHIRQFQLARLAFQVEVLQNGLRKCIVEMVKTSAKGDFDGALLLTQDYLHRLGQERANAEEAIIIAQRMLTGAAEESVQCLKRKEASKYLGISTDALRNWEMNGLLCVKRMRNGYRIYTGEDICRLKVIRALRCANYSLEAILRMLGRLSQDPDADINMALNTPREDADVVSVCDRLIVSLDAAKSNALQIVTCLQNMKEEFS